METQNLSRGEQSRAAILKAARELFVQQGFHGTSMRQIAKKSGIALGGLYNHFESKEQVFESVFLEYHPYREVIPALLAARPESIEEFSREAIERMIKALENRSEFLNLMFIEVVEFNSVHVGELFVNLMPNIVTIVERVFENNRNRLRNIPPMILMRFYFGLFFSYFLTETIFSKHAPPEFREGAVDHFIDIFLHGVMQEANSEEPQTGHS